VCDVTRDIVTVILRVYELITVTTSEYPINRFANPNPRLSHWNTWQYCSSINKASLPSKFLWLIFCWRFSSRSCVPSSWIGPSDYVWWRSFQRAGWCSGNALDMYSGSAWFECRQGHQTWRFQWFSSVPSGKFLDNTSTSPRLLPYNTNFLLISYISHPIIRRYIVQLLRESSN
jgi:hypothetical protein